MSDVVFTSIDSPIGTLLLAGEDGRLARIGFPAGKGRVAPAENWRRDDLAFAEARGQLAAYFSGRLTRFELDLDPRGTEFQRAVWGALAKIPFGVTRSYGVLAEMIGRPGSSRAVGAANGANPLPIVLPCHRVIGSNGSLTGFGGGIETKRWLLMHEGVLLRPEPMLLI